MILTFCISLTILSHPSQEEARKQFQVIMNDLYDLIIAPSVGEIERLVDSVEDNVKSDKLNDGTALTPQQIKKGVQKWHNQFVSIPSFSCAHTWCSQSSLEFLILCIL